MSDPHKRITAAGTVVLRPTETGRPEVLLVHRPRYDDWSLPKGKLTADEYAAACAVRETREETAVEVRLGIPIGKISYPVGGGVKSVSYWQGHLSASHHHRPNNEVDQIGWFSITNGLRQASYPDERELIRQAVNLSQATPIIVLRHAKAMLRANWAGRDQARPINERGRRQSKALTSLLAAYGVERLVSSTANRCMKTLQPYAKANRLEVEGWAALTEEQAVQDPKPVSRLMRRLVAEAIESGRPTAVCGHRPVLPTMLAAMGVPERALQPAAGLVAHLGTTGDLLALEIHKPRL